MRSATPNRPIVHAIRNTHLKPGPWRAVNIHHNAIFLENFMHELAQSAGQDPFEFRRKLTASQPGNLAVQDAVAQKGGLGQAGGTRRVSRVVPHDITFA